MQDRYEDEVEYWRGVLGKLRDGLPDDALGQRIRKQLDREEQLDPLIAEELPAHGPFAELNVLDVGCGPLTVLGKRAGSARLNITGVDPLADQYRRMLGEIGIDPPFELRQGFGEEVDHYFPHAHFDFVHSRNALDHSQQPHVAIRSMLRVAKNGSAIWVNVNRNEAINASYNGLHSWNFDVLFDTIVVWNPSEAIPFERIVEGLPFKWTVTEIGAKKTCPQEIDIVIYKDGVDLSAMTCFEPGVYGAITGRNAFITLWAPADLDERYNVFIHGYNKDGRMVLNRSFRWYNSLRRRSVSLPSDLGITYVHFGQFDVTFEASQPRYRNLWVGTLAKG